jgi:MFS family permease
VPVVAVILPGLLLFGPLSDITGRRLLVVVVAGLAVFGVGDALFAAATSTGWLFAARLAQGLGMAVLTAAAAATLSGSAAGFIAGREAAQRAAALASTLAITGLAAGPLLGGILAQYGPDRLRLPFLVGLALVAATVAAAVSLPGKPPGRHGQFRPAQLKIPVALRSFPVTPSPSSSPGASSGVFSAVIPTLIGQILRTGNLALNAGGLTLMIGASAATQIAAPRLRPATALLAGLATLAAGLALLVAASSARSTALVVLAMLASGAAHGLAFAGNLTKVTVTPRPRSAARSSAPSTSSTTPGSACR